MHAKRHGFTLIELLIVIAIIGILAAVLVPNLMRARLAARDRAAQAYAQNIYKAGNAYLAQDLSAIGADIVTPCGSGTTFDPGGAGTFTVGDPGTSVTSCLISDLGGFDFEVEVESPTGRVIRYPDN